MSLVAARYTLVSVRAATNASASLIDTVEVRSIELGKLRHSPVFRVLFDVLVDKIPVIKEDKSEPKRLHLPRRGEADSLRRFHLHPLGRVGHPHPAAGG